MKGRVNSSKSHIKLVMEPGFEPKQSHALNHYTALLPIVGAQWIFEWMSKPGFGKGAHQLCFKIVRHFPYHLFEVDISLAM